MGIVIRNCITKVSNERAMHEGRGRRGFICILRVVGSCTLTFQSLPHIRLVSMAASTQILITLGSPELGEQPA
jgi:hypothetical protein